MSRLLLLPPTVGGVPNQPAAGQLLVATGAGNKVIGATALVYNLASAVQLQLKTASPIFQLQDTGAALSRCELRTINGVAILNSNWGGATTDLSLRINMVEKLKINGTTGNLTAANALGVNGAAAPAQVTGFGVPTGTGVINAFPGATATLAQCSQAIAQLITDFKAIGFYGA